MSVKALLLIFGPGAEGIFLTSEMGFALSKKKNQAFIFWAIKNSLYFCQMNLLIWNIKVPFAKFTLTLNDTLLYHTAEFSMYNSTVQLMGMH